MGFAALEASLACLERLGVANIHAHVNRYLDVLEPALVDRGFTSVRAKPGEARSGILSLRPPRRGSLAEMQKGLSERGVVCSMPDGYLRFAPHYANSLDEIPFVLSSVDAVLRS